MDFGAWYWQARGRSLGLSKIIISVLFYLLFHLGYYYPCYFYLCKI